MKILFFGDIVGKPGRLAVAQILPKLKKEYEPDLVIANVENLAHGKGVTLSTLNFMIAAGVDFFTSGNHIFDKPEATAVFEKYPDQIIRPANFPDDLPGKGYALFGRKNPKILIINLNGQAFMEKQFDQGRISNPFERLNEILNEVGEQAKIKILDFHAEATSEKRAMGLWADGRLSAVLGTHTHVATADAQVLPHGTGYITDVGMVGGANSVIGVDAELALKRLLSPPDKSGKVPLEVAQAENWEVGYCLLEIDDQTGKCKNVNSQLVVINSE